MANPIAATMVTTTASVTVATVATTTAPTVSTTIATTVAPTTTSTSDSTTTASTTSGTTAAPTTVTTAATTTILTTSTTVATTVTTTATIATTTVTTTVTTTTTIATTTVIATSTTQTTTTISTTKTTSSTTTTLAVGNWSTVSTTVIGGLGTGASQLNNPWGLVFDSSDNLYIADRLNHRIQKVALGASVATTVAGQSSCVSGSDSAHLTQPTNIQLDASGNLYIADMGNNRIQFWAQGATSGTTVAGTGVAGSANNQFDVPYGLALDVSTGTLYISDYNNHRIMRYLSGASSGTVVAGGNGQGSANTQTSFPVGVIYESTTNSLAIINTGSHNVVRWILGGSNWILLAGSPAGVGTAGNTATTLNTPEGVDFDPMGNLYVADRLNQRVQFFLSGQLTGKTVAGTTGVIGSNATLLNNPYAVALDSNLNMYVADRYNNRVLEYARV